MPASRIQTSWHCAAIVRVVISSWRIRNIVSSSTSGSVSLDDITSFSSPGSFIETSPIAPRCRRAIAEVTAYDSSAGVLGWNRPLSSRASTAGGLDQGDRDVEGRVDGAVHGDQEVVADDLVELEQVHVAGPAEVRGLRGDEDVVLVGVHGRDVVALAAAFDDHRVAPQAGQQRLGLVVPRGYVDPVEAVVVGEQLDDVVRVAAAYALPVDACPSTKRTSTGSAWPPPVELVETLGGFRPGRS